jgi:single-strand DNA-binding protein
MSDVMVTVKGYVAKDPVLGESANGVVWTTIRVASTHSFRDRATGQWVDGQTLWFTVRVFADKARNLVTSVRKGTPVVVYGRLSVREYDFTREVRQGEGTSSEVTTHMWEMAIENATVAVDTSRGPVVYSKTNHTKQPPTDTPTQMLPNSWEDKGANAAPEGAPDEEDEDDCGDCDDVGEAAAA